MEQIIKIAVIGGTGKSGKYLVKQLLTQGFRFKILVRNADSRKPGALPIKNSFIEIVKGDVKDYEVIRSLVSDCHAVISTLGLGQPPSELSIFSQGTKNVIRAMNACNVHRYVLITGLNVDTPLDKKSPKTKFATDWMYANYPESTTDRQTEYDVLSDSNVDWTLVRLPLIEETEVRNEVSVSLEDCLGDKISATDLAHFLIKQLSDDTYVKKAPFIANT